MSDGKQQPDLKENQQSDADAVSADVLQTDSSAAPASDAPAPTMSTDTPVAGSPLDALVNGDVTLEAPATESPGTPDAGASSLPPADVGNESSQPESSTESSMDANAGSSGEPQMSTIEPVADAASSTVASEEPALVSDDMQDPSAQSDGNVPETPDAGPTMVAPVNSGPIMSVESVGDASSPAEAVDVSSNEQRDSSGDVAMETPGATDTPPPSPMPDSAPTAPNPPLMTTEVDEGDEPTTAVTGVTGGQARLDAIVNEGADVSGATPPVMDDGTRPMEMSDLPGSAKLSFMKRYGKFAVAAVGLIIVAIGSVVGLQFLNSDETVDNRGQAASGCGIVGSPSDPANYGCWCSDGGWQFHCCDQNGENCDPDCATNCAAENPPPPPPGGTSNISINVQGSCLVASNSGNADGYVGSNCFVCEGASVGYCNEQLGTYVENYPGCGSGQATVPVGASNQTIICAPTLEACLNYQIDAYEQNGDGTPKEGGVSNAIVNEHPTQGDACLEPTNTPTPTNTPPPDATLTPTATSTPTPTSTPSPTPNPQLACFDLSYTPQSPMLGTTVSFTCTDTGDISADYANFQVSRDGGEYFEMQRTGNMTAELTLTETGDYAVRCQVCVGVVDAGACSDWQVIAGTN